MSAEALGVDEYREIAYAVSESGVLQFTPLRVAGTYPPIVVPGLDGARITAVAQSAAGRHTLGTSDGRIVPLEVRFKVEFKDGSRVLTPEHEFGSPFALDPQKKRPIVGLTSALLPSGPIVIAQVGAAELVVHTVVEKKALIGEARREALVQPLTIAADGPVTALRVDGRGQDLFLGTARGQLVRYDLRDSTGAAPHGRRDHRHGADHGAPVPQR